MISVALCTYNGEKYLHRQLDSILLQTVPVDEIVIVDDLSTDYTSGILDDYASNYPGIFRIFKNKKNIGAKKNFEKALYLCKGDIIFLSDQDDVWDSHKVQRIIAHFDTHEEDRVVFTNAGLIDSDDHPLQYSLWEVNTFTKEVRDYTDNKDNLLRYLLKYGKIVTGATVAIKKDILGDILPFKLMHKMWHDAWIALVAANFHALGYIDEPLIKYRLHSNQQVGYNYLQKIKKMDAFSDLQRSEMNNSVKEEELHLLVHARRKRVRLIKRLSRVMNMDPYISREIIEECRLAEEAFAEAKPLHNRLIETFRKMFNK
jgi:glycosyltransferase involved in cell wall biosynthesis